MSIQEALRLLLLLENDIDRRIMSLKAINSDLNNGIRYVDEVNSIVNKNVESPIVDVLNTDGNETCKSLPEKEISYENILKSDPLESILQKARDLKVFNESTVKKDVDKKLNEKRVNKPEKSISSNKVSKISGTISKTTVFNVRNSNIQGNTDTNIFVKAPLKNLSVFGISDQLIFLKSSLVHCELKRISQFKGQIFGVESLSLYKVHPIINVIPSSVLHEAKLRHQIYQWSNICNLQHIDFEALEKITVELPSYSIMEFEAFSKRSGTKMGKQGCDFWRGIIFGVSENEQQRYVQFDSELFALLQRCQNVLKNVTACGSINSGTVSINPLSSLIVLGKLLKLIEFIYKISSFIFIRLYETKEINSRLTAYFQLYSLTEEEIIEEELVQRLIRVPLLNNFKFTGNLEESQKVFNDCNNFNVKYSVSVKTSTEKIVSKFCCKELVRNFKQICQDQGNGLVSNNMREKWIDLWKNYKILRSCLLLEAKSSDVYFAEK